MLLAILLLLVAPAKQGAWFERGQGYHSQFGGGPYSLSRDGEITFRERESKYRMTLRKVGGELIGEGWRVGSETRVAVRLRRIIE